MECINVCAREAFFFRVVGASVEEGEKGSRE